MIEAAHAVNAANPDYTNAEDFMGWGTQRGGALVNPALQKHVAERARERTAVLKETRKYQEERRLVQPKFQAKGDPKAPKGLGKGKDGAPE